MKSISGETVPLGWHDTVSEFFVGLSALYVQSQASEDGLVLVQSQASEDGLVLLLLTVRLVHPELKLYVRSSPAVQHMPTASAHMKLVRTAAWWLRWVSWTTRSAILSFTAWPDPRWSTLHPGQPFSRSPPGPTPDGPHFTRQLAARLLPVLLFYLFTIPLSFPLPFSPPLPLHACLAYNTQLLIP